MERPRSALALALTMGEPAGIGPEITLAAWRQRNAVGLRPFYCLADPDMLRQRAESLGWDVTIITTEADRAVQAFQDGLPVVPLSRAAKAKPADPNLDDVALIVESIKRAVEDVHVGRAAALVTNPINKQALRAGGFALPGHTEFLSELARKWHGDDFRAVMMIAGPELRTVPVTIHIPLAEVPTAITIDLIVETGQIVAADLRRRFGLSTPRLAVAGLNPHAGEEGSLGSEDDAVIRPAVEALQALGIAATGPLPADTMFHRAAREAYDVALCMYHDQALIPAKTLTFDEAVNVTLGLPLIRTSPGHGTAFDIAGSGRARPSSLIAALGLAAQMVATQTAR